MCADCALNRICILLFLSKIAENLRFESIDHSNASFVNDFINRLKESNEMQLYADIYLLLNYSTCFGRPSGPS